MSIGNLINNLTIFFLMLLTLVGMSNQVLMSSGKIQVHRNMYFS